MLARALAPPDSLLEQPEDPIAAAIQTRPLEAAKIRFCIERGASRATDTDISESEKDALAVHAAQYHCIQRTEVDFHRLYVCDGRAPFATLRRLRRHARDLTTDQPLILVNVDGIWRALNSTGKLPNECWHDVVLCKDAGAAIAEFFVFAQSLSNDRGLGLVADALFADSLQQAARLPASAGGVEDEHVEQ
jgi:hypothetical protein